MLVAEKDVILILQQIELGDFLSTVEFLPW
jgi:hypothetical protein